MLSDIDDDNLALMVGTLGETSVSALANSGNLVASAVTASADDLLGSDSEEEEEGLDIGTESLTIVTEIE